MARGRQSSFWLEFRGVRSRPRRVDHERGPRLAILAVSCALLLFTTLPLSCGSVVIAEAGASGASGGQGGATTTGASTTSSSASGEGGTGTGGAPCVPVDDGNACTKDLCADDVPVHAPVGDGVACDDGDGCTRADTCQGGECVGDDAVACTGDASCVAGACVAPACSGSLRLPGLPVVATGAVPLAVVASDLDADGDLDLATANTGSDDASVLLNLGDGTFAAAAAYPAGPSPRAVVASDLNGDAKPDLAVVHEDGVRVLLNLDGGTFGAGIDHDVGRKPGAVAAGDFDGDGLSDLAVTDYSGVNVLLQQADGTLGPATSFPAGPSFSWASPALAVADVDGDGSLDVALSYDVVQVVRVLLNDGAGTLSPAVDYPLDARPTDIALADVDDDGLPDIVTANMATLDQEPRVNVLLNQGGGTFAPAVGYGVDPGSSSIKALAVEDLDADGMPDLVVAGDTFSVLFNHGDGTFEAPVPYCAKGSAVAVGDLDGDGHPDVALGHHGVDLLMNLGDGALSAAALFSVSPINHPEAVAAADLDGDGKPDLVVSRGGGMSVFSNQGDGTFGPPVDYLHAAYAIATADVNGDGMTDLALAQHSNKVAILLNQGDGTFGAEDVYHLFSESTKAVTTADVDADGWPDVVVGRDFSLSVLLNQGNGTFGPAADYAVYSVDAIAAPDFDGDGMPDIVVGGPYGLAVLLNKGDGTFGHKVAYDPGGAVTSIATLDLDGDGDLDLAVSTLSGSPPSLDDGDVNVLLNQGDGTFSAPINFGVGLGTSVVAVDMDGGGEPDLVVAGNGALSVLLNQGGVFGPPLGYPSISVGVKGDAITTADFDSNGRPDVGVIGWRPGGNVAVLGNDCAP